MIVVHQHQAFCLNRFIHIYEIVITPHAFNVDVIRTLNKSNPICYKLNESRAIAVAIGYKLNKNVISMLINVNYDAFHIHPSKIHHFHAIVFIIKVKNMTVYLIETLGIIIKSLMKYLYLFIHSSINTIVVNGIFNVLPFVIDTLIKISIWCTFNSNIQSEFDGDYGNNGYATIITSIVVGFFVDIFHFIIQSIDSSEQMEQPIEFTPCIVAIKQLILNFAAPLSLDEVSSHTHVIHKVMCNIFSSVCICCNFEFVNGVLLIRYNI